MPLDPAISAMLARLEAAGVAHHGGLKLVLEGAQHPVVIGRVCDDEPLAHTEWSLGLGHPERVVRGLAAAAVICSATRALLVVDASRHRLVQQFRREAQGTSLEVVALPPAYPMDATAVICDLAQLQGCTVPAAGLDRALMLDAVTLCDVAVALDGRYPLRRTVTVAGAVADPAVLQVPLGSTMADLVQACGGADSAGWVPAHNGLLGGGLVSRDHAVDWDTRSVVVLSGDHDAVKASATPVADQLRRVPAACVNCRVCTEVCPAHLAGAAHQPHAVMASVATSWPGADQDPELAVLGALECIGCGLCNTICPAALRPGEVSGHVARLLGQRGLVPPPSATPQPHADRPSRRHSMQRLVQRLGLAAADQRLSPVPRNCIPDQITLGPCGPGGGARVPLVAAGDRVDLGDRVALAAAGSGEVDCRSPVAGVVLAVDPDDGVTIQPR